MALDTSPWRVSRVTALIEQIAHQGGAGWLLFALSLLVIAYLYSQNQALQKEIRQTLREVFPALTALQSAIDFIQRSGSK